MNKAKRWSAAAAVMMLGAVAVSFPMRLALDGSGAADAGLSARAVQGSLWSGHLVEARFGPVALGDMQIGMSAWSVLMGSPRLDFARVEGQGASAMRLEGNLSTGQKRGLVDGTGRVDLGQQLGPIRLDHMVMEGVTALVDGDGRCVQAGGQLRLMLGGAMAGLPLAQGLSGGLSCAQGKLRASLASQSGMERLMWEMDGSGAWQARVTVEQADDPAMVMALGQMGFRPSGTAYVMTLAGRY